MNRKQSERELRYDRLMACERIAHNLGSSTPLTPADCVVIECALGVYSRVGYTAEEYTKAIGELASQNAPLPVDLQTASPEINQPFTD